MSTPTELGLRAEVRNLREQLKVLADQVISLQAANEGAYRELYDTTGGPRFDPGQPFGRTATGDGPVGFVAESGPSTYYLRGGAA
jgi:hypothetical protein